MVRVTRTVGGVVCVIGVVALGACSNTQASPTTDRSTTATTVVDDTEYTVPIEVVVTTPPPNASGPDDGGPDVVADEPVSSQVAVVVTEPDLEGIMPDVLCMDLQDAQNLIQTRGVFFSRSEDASGDGRRQIIDRNWIVVAQTPAAGEPIGEGDALLSVLKDAEVSECAPGG